MQVENLKGLRPGQALIKQEMEGRYSAAIAKKLKVDCLATDAERFRKKAEKTSLMKKT